MRAVGPAFGDSRTAAVARRLLGPLRRRDVVIPFGVCAGTPFNAGGSAPSFALGTSEPHVQELLRELLGPGDVFYDIGANVGFLTVLGARRVGPAGRVYAFEPVPENVEAIHHNVRMSQWQHVEVLAAAAGARPGRATMALGGEPFWSRLTAFGTPPGSRGTITVRCLAVDDLVEQGRIAPPHVVKIDVEGAEVDVLRGMARTLRTARPVVVCEVHDDADHLRAFLAAAGYAVHPVPCLSALRSRTSSRHVVARPL